MKSVPVRLNGEDRLVNLRMWSKRTRDQLERKYGIPGQQYAGGMLGAISTAKGPNIDLLRNLFQQEIEKMNKAGAGFEVEKVAAVTGLTVDDVWNLPDDEFDKLQDAVIAFLSRRDDRVTLLKASLAELLAPHEREAALKLVDSVMLGESDEKN